MDWKLELVAIPVSDVDRAKAFYAEKVGFNADHDHRVSEEIRFVVLPTYPVAHMLDLGAFMLVLLAMPGFYARQASGAGRLGLLGFVLTMLFVAGTCELLMWEAFGAPQLAANPATTASGFAELRSTS